MGVYVRKLCVSNIFVLGLVLVWTLSPVCWHLSPWYRVWLVLGDLKSVQDVRWGFLFALWLLLPYRGRVCPSVVFVFEVLSVRCDMPPLPLSVSSALNKVVVEACEAHEITEALCDAYPFLCCVHLRSSTRLWLGVGTLWLYELRWLCFHLIRTASVAYFS